MQLYNTLSKKLEELRPVASPSLSMYSCGPTVYDYTHIGHLRTYILTDILRRTLIYRGFDVHHVMNITDVGHLTGDDDQGIDKMEKGADKHGTTVWELAQHYTDYFKRSMEAVHVVLPEPMVRATDHITPMIQLIQRLEHDGHTYSTSEAVYFDITTFPRYGHLSRQKLEEKKQAAREEIHIDPGKKHPADFALWFKRIGRFAKHIMYWPSPWGDGFPGWHIECSAMSMHYLGETIDIHTGGVDHIPVHHENEIAQSEGATGKPFVRHWVHCNHLLVDGVKMSKSLGNFYTIDSLLEKGYDPMAFRLLVMQTHYRQSMNFTWEALDGAQKTWEHLKQMISALKTQEDRTMLSEEKLSMLDYVQLKFSLSLDNDLQIPQALSFVWELLKSNIPSADKLQQLYECDAVLGLGLEHVSDDPIPGDVDLLVKERTVARSEKDYARSDRLREQIEQKGYAVEDTEHGSFVKKKLR